MSDSDSAHAKWMRVALDEAMKAYDKKDIPIEFKEVNDNTLVNNRIGSTEKAKTELGFEAETPLEEGLMKVIEWKLNQ